MKRQVPILPLLVVFALTATAPLAHAARAEQGARSQAGSSARSNAREAKRDGDATTRGRPRVAPRILDDIRIEGEIPVPQVLFITARDQRRFMEFQHHRYQVTSLELGRATPAPRQLVVPTPSPDKKEQEDPR